MKTGTIYAPRKKELGFPNYFWRCAFSGLKSAMGFNSKAQKALIKEEEQKVEQKEKKEKKEKKRK
jgi:hypothetical protein